MNPLDELGRVGKEFYEGFVGHFLNNLILVLEEKNLINDSEIFQEKV